jgi:hypothetical protein
MEVLTGPRPVESALVVMTRPYGDGWITLSCEVSDPLDPASACAADALLTQVKAATGLSGRVPAQPGQAVRE